MTPASSNLRTSALAIYFISLDILRSFCLTGGVIFVDIKDVLNDGPVYPSEVLC